MATYRTSAAGGATSGTGDRTATIVPAVGDLLVAFAFVSTNTNDTPTMTDNNTGGTWTRIGVANVVIAALNHRLSVFVRDALMVNTTSTVVTAGTGSNTSGVVHVIALSGMSRVGSDAVRSSGKQDNQAAGTPAPVLNQAALTGNVTIVAAASADTTTTAPTNWTERQDTNQATPTVALETATRDSGFTGTTITFGAAQSTTFASYALEMDGSTPATNLVVQDGAHAHAADAPSLTQVHALIVADGALGHVTDSIALAVTHVLAVQDATHGHTADSPTLAVTSHLEVQDATHGHTTDALVLTQVHVLAVEDGALGHLADAPSLTQVHELEVQGADHDHTVESPSLTQVHVLEVEDAAHSHLADGVVLGGAGEFTLVVQDAVHGHTADDLTLGLVTDLVVQDATHGHSVETIALTQVHILVVSDGAHVLTSDEVNLANLGLPVFGPTRARGTGRHNKLRGGTGRNRSIGG